ncbi:hypothetical protein ACFGVS_21660 [Mucilaginibacter sp. AW1-7]|uniref:hypothetical protein n=1 Tax=Mucilaginibacter sp. AW1-7 TaxID=3349874 RepID=UPI003F7394B4
MVSGFLMGAAPKPALPTGLCSPGAIFRRFLLKCFSSPGQRRVVQLLPPSITGTGNMICPPEIPVFMHHRRYPFVATTYHHVFLPRSGLPSNMRVIYRRVQVAPTAHKSFLLSGATNG